MRPRSTVFAALTTAITFGLTACGQPAAPQSPSRDQNLSVSTVVPQADPAAKWADAYCGAVAHLVRALSSLPAVDPSSPAQTSRTTGELLAAVVGGLDRSLAGLTALGAPPVAGADAGRADVIAQFTEIRAQAESARQHIDDVRGDAEATKAALGAAKATLDRLDALDYLKGVGGVPALKAAGQRAPSCRQLDQPPR